MNDLKSGFSSQRYLTGFHAREIPHQFADVIVVGTGAAGLRAAIEAAGHCNVLLLSKQTCEETATAYAQGGIAAVLDAADSVEQHVEDTLRTGCGLCDARMVRAIVGEGPERIRELLDWGAKFDREDGRLAFTREGGHSRARILHADGDSTGAELMNTLIRKARALDKIRWKENCFAIDLLTRDRTCLGVLAHDGGGGFIARGHRVILATGGCGRIYRETTNPSIATGDGIAMAYRAGADIENVEFVQFHPTTLYLAGASRALISEAVRGEGARLVNKSGQAFMKNYHLAGDLAPRDVVSRAVLAEMDKTGDTNVYLDFSHMDPQEVYLRFPRIKKLCAACHLDITRHPIPVRPSAHYMVGGVKTDGRGRTTIKNLFAAGEVACTGFHGANRLGSNSLLESVVMGRRAGAAAGETAAKRKSQPKPLLLRSEKAAIAGGDLDLADLENSLRSLMWRIGGIVRNGPALEAALGRVRFWQSYVLKRQFSEPEAWSLQNMMTVAELVLRAALIRRESRGVHYRKDFPNTNDRNWKHTVILRREEAEPG
ncbi:MAG: L-aspartate oxidase [Planctomycetota bacterium]|nr:MAG: L-aspartate oxidase [Planctomycetota bacterium]